MSKILFVDMDGTIARFYEMKNYLDRMYEPGCFISLNPYTEMVKAIARIIEKKEIRVIFHTAYPDGNPSAADEKLEWIKKVFKLKKFEYIIVKTPSNKALEAEKYLGRQLTKSDFLIDDYTVNLRNWEKFGGSGIKCVNEIQDKADVNSYDGPRINAEEDALYIYNYLMRIIGTSEIAPALVVNTRTASYRTYEPIVFEGNCVSIKPYGSCETVQLPHSEIIGIVVESNL